MRMHKRALRGSLHRWFAPIVHTVSPKNSRLFHNQSMHRRRFTQTLIQTMGSALVFGAGGFARGASWRHNPFALGVASGSPAVDGFVLWTRLLAEPGGAPLPVSPIELRWELALEPQFRQPLRSGTVWALPEEAHSVHLEVQGLPPDNAAAGAPPRHYWYRFIAGDAVSPVGRCRTLPAPGSRQALRLALASCQNYEHGYFGAYRHMAEEDLDCVLFVGDYIYEYGITAGRVRQHNGPTCLSLQDYRERYALYKSDPDLQKAHAAFPWIVTWDDHEVANDYANDRSAGERGAEFLARRAAAYRAYWEHQPLRIAQKPSGPNMPLFRSYAWGQTANLHVLDTRQYRDYQVCTPEGQGGSRTLHSSTCPQRLTQANSLLGNAQEAWLQRQLDRSHACFDLVGQQSIMAPMRMPNSRTDPDAGADLFWNDSWDGYPLARARALEHWGRRGNVITMGGDVHATYISDLKANFDEPRSATLATEVVGTSISSPSWSQAAAERVKSYNPHMQYAKSDQRGYTILDVGMDYTHVKLRVIDNARIQNSALSTAASFTIAAGKPGAQHT
jgi:alkaline phosphatase D